MIEIKPYIEETHYEILSEWWRSHGWQEVAKSKLPPFGFVIEVDDKLVAASFAYLDNGGTGVAMLEWTVGNPDANPRHLLKGLRLLFDFVSQELKRLEYDCIFTSCKVPGMIKILEKVGFTKTDDGMTHLVKLNTD